jgi:hypothetical protein
LGWLVAEFIPLQMFKDFNERYADRIDFLSSNVPGPRKELIYGGSRVSDIIGFTFVGGLGIFIPIISYNDHFRISVTINECTDIDGDKFIKYLDEGLCELK